LDWDGLGFMSALEQNFNPSVEDIKRRTALGKWNTFFFKFFVFINFFLYSVSGYPRLLSGDLLVSKKLANMHAETLFPGSATEDHTFAENKYRRHLLSFPMYPFRTLCPRDAQRLMGNSDFDQTSPIFPANTQLNIKFSRRPVANLLNYMLPTNLNLNRGAASNSLTQDERNNALDFTVSTVNADGGVVNTEYRITGITINVQDMYLQVKSGQGSGGLPFLHALPF
jgi:hypothetical protein